MHQETGACTRDEIASRLCPSYVDVKYIFPAVSATVDSHVTSNLHPRLLLREVAISRSGFVTRQSAFQTPNLIQKRSIQAQKWKGVYPPPPPVFPSKLMRGGGRKSCSAGWITRVSFGVALSRYGPVTYYSPLCVAAGIWISARLLNGNVDQVMLMY